MDHTPYWIHLGSMLSYCIWAPLFNFDPSWFHIGSKMGPNWIQPISGPCWASILGTTSDHQGPPRHLQGAQRNHRDLKGILKDHQPPRHTELVLPGFLDRRAGSGNRRLEKSRWRPHLRAAGSRSLSATSARLGQASDHGDQCPPRCAAFKDRAHRH